MIAASWVDSTKEYCHSWRMHLIGSCHSSAGSGCFKESSERKYCNCILPQPLASLSHSFPTNTCNGSRRAVPTQWGASRGRNRRWLPTWIDTPWSSQPFFGAYGDTSRGRRVLRGIRVMGWIEDKTRREPFTLLHTFSVAARNLHLGEILLGRGP